MCPAVSLWLSEGPVFFVWPLWQLSGSGFKAKASVVAMLHLCPAGNPVLFLWLLGLKSQIELITLIPANFHPAVLWHYPVVDGSLEESKLVGKQKVHGDYMESRSMRRNGCHNRGDLGLQSCEKSSDLSEIHDNTLSRVGVKKIKKREKQF